VATRAVLADYLDGETLTDSTMGDEVAVHLAECGRCRGLARQLRAQRLALAALAARESAERMRPAFRARMEALLGGPLDARVPRAG
jgi:predicted anti-sigma-YlaC factor YlaD